MRLLILDLLRRGRGRAAAFAALLLVMLWMAAEIDSPRYVVGFSMGAAFALGPQLTLWFVPRPVWYLPISRRTVWRAGWLAATVGTALWLALPKLAALILLPTPSYGLATVLLSAVFDFACAGAGCGLVILATHPRPARAPWHQLAPLWKAAAEFALPLGMLVVFYVNWNPDALPLRWSQLTQVSGALLGAALTLAAATFFYVPSPPDRSSLLFSLSGSAGPARDRRAPGTLDAGGPTGLGRLLLQEYAFALMLGLGIAAASVVLVLVMAGVFRADEGVAEVLRAQMLLLDGAYATEEWIGFRALAWLMWYGFFVASLMARFPEMLRHLRVLPLGMRRLHALLIAWPAVVWISVWTAVFAVRYAVAGQRPRLFHLALLVALWGASALAQSLTLGIHRHARIFWFGVAAGSVGAVPFLPAPHPAWLAACGLGALGAAAIINARALRAHATYGAGFSPLSR